jgi:hypothetical protein
MECVNETVCGQTATAIEIPTAAPNFTKDSYYTREKELGDAY